MQQLDNTYLFWQKVDTYFVFIGICPELNLGKNLIAERVAHDKARVTHSTTQVHKTAFC